jgi:hypothetical protein
MLRVVSRDCPFGIRDAATRSGNNLFSRGSAIAENKSVLPRLTGRTLSTPVLNAQTDIFANPVFGVCPQPIAAILIEAADC